ncbi:uncharacterized protein TrAFT101_011468 [Trichoderma asperellum]|nr:hypothetical protein TrAFT101_011468 [Trichoderma asperellum]
MWSMNAIAFNSGHPAPQQVPRARPQTTSIRYLNKSSTAPSSPNLNQPSSPMSPMSAADFFEPAMDRPPSPGRIRQLNSQMRRASQLRRQNGHRTAASASVAANGESPGWEQTLENLSLGRRSSVKSTGSSAHSKERSDSVYGFGKNPFHRRARSKRESSANSSSASSMYSAEVPADSALASTSHKESFIQALTRRRASRDDTGAAQRKLNISGPYNFQHVTHTHRDSVAQAQEGPEQLTMRATGPTNVPSAANQAEGSALLFHPDAYNDSGAFFSRPAALNRQSQAVAPNASRRLMRRIRSQDQLRGSTPSMSPPPRPPRSPINPTAPQSGSPVSPSRSPSLQEEYEDVDEQPPVVIERPKTSGGFRHPQPFNPDDSVEPVPPIGPLYAAPLMTSREEYHAYSTKLSPIQPSPTEPSWPLASPTLATYETPLADVPEEEENAAAARRSIRGSQSVPMLRRSHRPASNASDTLGNLHMASVPQHAVVESSEKLGFQFGIIEESWEDDIDYCYEHEAEADCDYQWDRDSMDTARDSDTLPVEVSFPPEETSVPIGTARSSPGMLSVATFEGPGLSPISQTSTPTVQEAITPVLTAPVANNFSLPIFDKKKFRASHASSFKESHGFTLSPSLLIPGDFHQQMLLEEGARQEYPGEDDLALPYQQTAFYDENSKPVQWSQQRASTSTTGTVSTYSDTTADRHISTNSTWSFYTRNTASSSGSVHKMTGSWTECAEPLPVAQAEVPAPVDAEAEGDMTSPQDTVPELISFPLAPSRKSSHKSHASESIIHEDPSSSQKRRSRSRTASLSSQAPPVGQYALFPRSYIKPTGDRI